MFQHPTAPLLLLTLVLLVPRGVSADPVDQIAEDRLYITVDGEPLGVPLATNEDIFAYHPDRSRALVFCPDGTRRAVATGNVVRSVAYQGGYLPDVIVCGPQYLLQQDADAHPGVLEDDIALWDAQDWVYGVPSDSTEAYPRDRVESSFVFMDSLITALYTNNPHLEAITLFGESAGGKFMTRYLAVTRLYDIFDSLPLYIVSVNCGDFMYTSPHRPGLQDDFPVPSTQIQDWIPKYNDWPYGLDELHLSEYASETGAPIIAARYGQHAIFLLVGGQDHLINSDDKPMHLQGMTNLMRNVFFDGYLAFRYGDLPMHTVTVYPGLNHYGHDVTEHPDSWPPMFEYVPAPVAVEDLPARPEQPDDHGLRLAVAPNPSNARFDVTVTLPAAGPLELLVFNELGQRVATLTPRADRIASGTHRFTWDASGRASGAYFVRAVISGQTIVSKKVTLIK